MPAVDQNRPRDRRNADRQAGRQVARRLARVVVALDENGSAVENRDVPADAYDAIERLMGTPARTFASSQQES
jgi:hypothetical protein